ncbi:MAG: AMP-binding protein [Bdellovibrionia bacterium]
MKTQAQPRAGYYPGAHRGNNVHTFLEHHLAKDPNLVVLQWVNPQALKEFAANGFSGPLKHDSATVGQLHDHIGRVAAGFQKLGIGMGDRVIVFMPMSLYLYVAMFALQKIGAIAVFLDSWARRNHLGASAQIVAPKGMVSFEKAFELCSQVPELDSVPLKISVGPTTRKYAARLEELFQFPAFAESVPVEQEHTALITFTTGSSGTPKGANRTHRFLAAQHYALDECIPYTTSDADLPVFPIFSLNNLAAGVSTIIPAFDIGVPGDHDPEILLAQLEACHVTCTTLSPSLFNRLSAHCLQKGITLSGLRRVVTGGAPVSRDNVVDMQKVAPNADIWILFGSTEAEPMAHIEGREMVNQKTRAAEDPEWVDEGVNVGHMAEGLYYKFIKIQKGPVEVNQASDWASLEVSAGEVGELIVAGEHVCRNYYNDDVAFKRAKIMDENGTVWHRTGDLGRLDSEGNLWIVGRVHNAINRGGKYCFPVRAELIMKKLPYTQYAAYLGVSDEKLGEKTVAVIVPQDKSVLGTATESEMKQELLRIMDKNGVPVDQVLFREKIPMDPRHHSKVEYDVLRTDLMAEGLV